METNKTYSFQAKTLLDVETLLNVFCSENNVFSTQIFPILQTGTTMGYDVLVWYKTEDSVMVAQKSHELQASRFDSSSSDLITDYDKAKLDKITRQETGATKEVKMASEKQLDFLDKLGYKWAIPREMMTAKNAFQLIKGFKEDKK